MRKLRHAARAILLDPADRVLLLRYGQQDGPGFWATPGGGCEPGETSEECLARELLEELGLLRAKIGPVVAVRSAHHPVGEKTVLQVEEYHLVHTVPGDLPSAALSPDDILDQRWWTVETLQATDETIYPGQLADVVEMLLSHGVPAVPHRLS